MWWLVWPHVRADNCAPWACWELAHPEDEPLTGVAVGRSLGVPSGCPDILICQEQLAVWFLGGKIS